MDSLPVILTRKASNHAARRLTIRKVKNLLITRGDLQKDLQVVGIVARRDRHSTEQDYISEPNGRLLHLNKETRRSSPGK